MAQERIYVWNNARVADLTTPQVAQHYTRPGFETLGFARLQAQHLEVDEAVFDNGATILQEADRLVFTCTCTEQTDKLCSHQAEALLQVMRHNDWLIFFDTRLRDDRFRQFAKSYALEAEADLSRYFKLEYRNGHTEVVPAQASLFALTRENLHDAAQLLLPQTKDKLQFDADTQRILVLKQHKFYRHLMLELYDAPLSKDGQIKNPLKPVPPMEQMWQTTDAGELKFFAAVSRFQQNIGEIPSEAMIGALKAVVQNPLGVDVYVQTEGEKTSAVNLKLTHLRLLNRDAELTVRSKQPFNEISGRIKVGERELALSDLELALSCFVKLDDRLYLVKDMAMLGAINLFKKQEGSLLVHQSQFKALQSQVLDKLEETHPVRYPDIPQGTPKQIKEQGMDVGQERIIYLSDFGQHVMLIPVMRYGEVEISIRTDKQIYVEDAKGKPFAVRRDQDAEDAFTALLIKQHPHFAEQLADDLYYFYLHKKYFLDAGWFLHVFEEWQNQGITILGFNELSDNRLNPNKVKITINILSGLNWFNAKVNVRYGQQKAKMKHLYKAIRNKSKYVQLDDGTLGLLPEDWIKKFSDYFTAAEILDDDTLQIPAINFASIDEMYEDAMLDDTARLQIADYKEKLLNFDRLQPVPIPEGLNATLRHYQHEGLNWLNFLDDFNFGGCLADDMGLGKTLQIIAFILLQRTKVQHNTNLLVVPTSLIFNWQAEIARFAPSIKVHTVYGADRAKNTEGFDDYEVILTTYGTLLSDVNFLKNYNFNYIFLDESQNIKNPNSQRYRAARLLQSRNKIAITGTPIENNTFDLYGQLSFACPGLLGSRLYFKEIYLIPIDQFKVSKRAQELQKKIQPFILRRTKEQVAQELPDKTEMVLYCPMQEEQRKIYNTYEKEFRELVSATTEDLLKKSSMHVLKGITRLRQICDSPELLEGVRMPGNASAKIEALVEQIESKAPYHKILVFSQFVGMLELIKKELESRKIAYAWLTGSTRHRKEVVNEFQQNDAVRVFLISLKAGGTGLNLTAADYVYLVDPWWNPAIENQAIDRSYRIGQHKNVMAVRLICPDTVEEKIIQLQENKSTLAGRLITSDTGLFDALDKATLLGLLSH